MFKSLISLVFVSLISATVFENTALVITENVVSEMKNEVKSFHRVAVDDRNSAIAAIKAVRSDFPAVCVKVMAESVSMMADSDSKNSKMKKMNSAFKAIKLMDLGYLNLTVFAMHPELAKKAMKKTFGHSKHEFSDMMSTLDKRGFGNKAPEALEKISKVEMQLLQAGLKVLESDDTLELVMESL